MPRIDTGAANLLEELMKLPVVYPLLAFIALALPGYAAYALPRTDAAGGVPWIAGVGVRQELPWCVDAGDPMELVRQISAQKPDEGSEKADMLKLVALSDSGELSGRFGSNLVLIEVAQNLFGGDDAPAAASETPEAPFETEEEKPTPPPFPVPVESPTS